MPAPYYATIPNILLSGLRANQPSAADVGVGWLYAVTDEGYLIEQSDGASWSQWGPTPGSGGTVTHTGTLTAGQLVQGNGGVDVSTITNAAATALLNAMVGDSGAGGTKGLVPAPAAGDAAAGKYLKADGTWTAPSVSGTFWTDVVAASDQTVNNSTTLVDDSELHFDMDANGVYAFEGFIVGVSPVGAGTPDFKLTFTGPATLSGVWALIDFASAGGTNTGAAGAAVNTTQAFNTAATPTAARVSGWASSTGGGTGASGFRLQWAQNTLNANDLTRLAGSVLRYRKLG